MSNSLPDISIGEFAESLLNSDAIPPLHEAQAPSMASVPGSAHQLDITNVKVSDDFMAEVFSGKETNSYLDSILEGASPQASIPRQKKIPIQENVATQTERLSALLEQLAVVLSETKQLISEMAVGAGTTTVGTIGTGYSGPPKKKRKKKKSIKETVEHVLEEMRNGSN
jgi:hypothetical protein